MRSAETPTVAAMLALSLATALATSGACASRPAPGQFDGSVVNPFNATGVCQHTCTPDPGPAPMTGLEYGCPGYRDPTGAGIDKNIEFAPTYIWDFEEDRATGMYSYTDSTQPIASFFTIDDQTGLPVKETWEPDTSVMARCGNASNRVIHIQGGPFLGWGGGVGIAMKDYAGRVPPGNADPALSTATVNAMSDESAWEGISFWARRGPDSQGGIRVLAGDKHTDDDVSYLMFRDTPQLPRFCERYRECACLNHQACQEVDDASIIPAVCGPPGSDPSVPRNFCGTPQPYVGGLVSTSGGNVQCNTCLESRCSEVYPAYPDDQYDPFFHNKPCTSFTSRTGITSLFCYDPTKETVPEPDAQCGDHWTTPLYLTNDWQLYFVPFNAMTQQGWAKKFPSFDATAMSVFRFTWDGGWVDYYIDDVTFYRHTPPDAGP